jgi:hypothetical protein
MKHWFSDQHPFQHDPSGFVLAANQRSSAVVERYDPPVKIPLNGTSELPVIIAREIPIQDQVGARFRRLLSSSNTMEVFDETLAFRPIAVSA